MEPYRRFKKYLQHFAETTEPEETEPVEVELSQEPQDLKTTTQEATEQVVEAMAQVKQIEIQGLTAVIGQVKELMNQGLSLIDQMKQVLAETEALKTEAIDLVEALNSEQAELNPNDLANPATNTNDDISANGADLTNRKSHWEQFKRIL
jgi:Lon protease-like protein